MIPMHKQVAQRTLSPLGSRYGASMGRHSWAMPNEKRGRIYAQLVKLDSSGYDKGGSYWGGRSRGQSLYVVTDANESFEFWCDAASRCEAINKAVSWLHKGEALAGRMKDDAALRNNLTGDEFHLACAFALLRPL